MIILENIHKYYPADEEDLHVLNNINLHIKEGVDCQVKSTTFYV